MENNAVTIKPIDYDLTFNTPLTSQKFVVEGVMHESITRWPHFHSGWIITDRLINIDDIINIEVTHNGKTETVPGLRITSVSFSYTGDTSLFRYDTNNQEFAKGSPTTTWRIL